MAATTTGWKADRSDSNISVHWSLLRLQKKEITRNGYVSWCDTTGISCTLCEIFLSEMKPGVDQASKSNYASLENWWERRI